MVGGARTAARRSRTQGPRPAARRCRRSRPRLRATTASSAPDVVRHVAIRVGGRPAIVSHHDRTQSGVWKYELPRGAGGQLEPVAVERLEARGGTEVVPAEHRGYAGILRRASRNLPHSSKPAALTRSTGSDAPRGTRGEMQLAQAVVDPVDGLRALAEVRVEGDRERDRHAGLRRHPVGHERGQVDPDAGVDAEVLCDVLHRREVALVAVVVVVELALADASRRRRPRR